MKIDLNRYRNQNVITFEEDIVFDKDILLKAEIIDIPHCKVKGNIKKYEEGLYEIDLNIKGTMILECTISLEEVEYNFNVNVNKSFDSEGKMEENLKINANTLDIFPFIWENIVLEKPLRIVKENNKAVTEGEGWSLTGETKNENTSPLSELNKLLNMEEEK